MNYLRVLNKLLIYRNLLSDDLLDAMMKMEVYSDECAVASRLVEKAEEVGLAGDLGTEYIFYLLSYGDNVFSRTAERCQGEVGKSLLDAAARDIQLLREFFRQNPGEIFKEPLMHDYKPTRAGRNRSLEDIKKYFLDSSSSPEEAAQGLCGHYRRYGYGMLADHMAFKWDEATHGFIGVNSCDGITFDDIIGYDRQKADLIGNTEAFLQGLPANNVLLFGERGTGKSSSIKALVNRFFGDGLRLVEISRSQFVHLPAIMGQLKNWGKKFILYLDDLSFEEFEVEYKQLKSVIDGGIEVKPDNVLIYATSNRRNIVKEVWADSEGDELHRTDTINEKVSLADRFGIKIFFISPDQEAYFRIILEKANKAKLGLTPDELKKEAVKWEMTHSGRSGRTAEQLITYLIGRGQSVR